MSTADFLSGAFDRRLSFVSHNKMGFNVRTKLENCSQQTCIYIYIYIRCVPVVRRSRRAMSFEQIVTSSGQQLPMIPYACVCMRNGAA